MSDPHEQANVQQIEWLLGALADAQVLNQPLPTAPASSQSEPDDASEPDDLH